MAGEKLTYDEMQRIAILTLALALATLERAFVAVSKLVSDYGATLTTAVHATHTRHTSMSVRHCGKVLIQISTRTRHICMGVRDVGSGFEFLLALVTPEWAFTTVGRSPFESILAYVTPE